MAFKRSAVRSRLSPPKENGHPKGCPFSFGKGRLGRESPFEHKDFFCAAKAPQGGGAAEPNKSAVSRRGGAPEYPAYLHQKRDVHADVSFFGKGRFGRETYVPFTPVGAALIRRRRMSSPICEATSASGETICSRPRKNLPCLQGRGTIACGDGGGVVPFFATGRSTGFACGKLSAFGGPGRSPCG